MPTHIDYRTLFLASGLVGAALLTFLAMQTRRRYPGFMRVVVGLDLLTAAIVLADLRGYISDALWSVQVTALVALALVDSGIRLFCAAPRRGKWPFIYVLSAVLLQTYLFRTQPLHVRIIWNSLLAFPIFIDTAIPLLTSKTPKGQRFSYRFTATVLMLGCVASCVRIWAVLSLDVKNSPYFSANPANTVFFLLILLLLLALGFGMIALTHERLVAESKGAHERMLLALEASNSGTFEWNIKENVDHWDPMLEKLYGFEPGTFPGNRKAWLECVHPEEVARVDEANREALTTGYFDEQWRIRRKNDGQVRWILSHARVQFDQEGKPERMIGINVDVTDRKLAEEQVRLSEQRYRSLVEASSQLVWTCDGDGYPREAEDWQRFTGQTAEQVLGWGWSDAIHPDDRDKTLKAWQRAVVTKSIYAPSNIGSDATMAPTELCKHTAFQCWTAVDR